jgi:hypothetical protein
VADRSLSRCGGRRVPGPRSSFEGQDRADTMIGVAIDIAVWESRGELSQVVGADRLGAQRARRGPEGRPAIHQNESHGMPPNAIVRLMLLPPSVFTRRKPGESPERPRKRTGFTKADPASDLRHRECRDP